MKKSLLSVNTINLEEEKKVLSARLAKLVGMTDEGEELPNSTWTGYGQKNDENAAEVAEYESTISVEKSLRDRLSDIDTALLAIAAGTYGVCSVCKSTIEEARLSVMPTATKCLSCGKKNS
jgi:RNA polymerase-binding transcription factor DksA